MWIQTAVSSLLLVAVLSQSSCIVDGGCNGGATTSVKTECKDESTVTTTYTTGDCSGDDGTEVTTDGCEACSSYVVYSQTAYYYTTDCTGDSVDLIVSRPLSTCVPVEGMTMSAKHTCTSGSLTSTVYTTDDCSGSSQTSEVQTGGCTAAGGVSAKTTINECVSGASQITAVLLWIVIACNVIYS
eukprot:102044_1